MIGQLFTQDFLGTGIAETPAWQSVTEVELSEFASQRSTIYAQFKADTNLNESVTENQIILRVLTRLGWTDIVREQDPAAFGRYLTKDLVLAYMNAIAAGDLKSVVNV